MDLILHIGMGKTGSSAIQAALLASADCLATQGAEYLGMWFDMVDPHFRGVENQNKFFNLSHDEMVRSADVLIEMFRARSESGVETFILSNEALSGQAGKIKPLLDRLREAGITIRVVGYARHPAAWLPSAYVQWGIRDKVGSGPVQPYAVKARELVHWYSGLLHWHRQMPDILEVRSYDQTTDIVGDFMEAVGLDLKVPHKRVLERGEDAEIVMRALFNNRFPKHVLPAVFDQTVSRKLNSVPRLEDVIEKSFDYSETDLIISEEEALFNQFSDAFGFDVRAYPKSSPSKPEIGDLRNRLLDVLLEITLDQAQRIRRLEQRIDPSETVKN